MKRKTCSLPALSNTVDGRLEAAPCLQSVLLSDYHFKICRICSYSPSLAPDLNNL